MRALVLVDLQYDFMPEGALAVPRGDEVVEVANRLMERFDLVVASRDWHPANHGSFASQHPGLKAGDFVKLDGIDQVLWPDHCVQETRGAMLHHALRSERIRKIVDKGTDPKIDSYSAFFDNAHRRATGLGDYLRSENVDEAFLMGLATDYCVRGSVLDAVKLGYRDGGRRRRLPRHRAAARRRRKRRSRRCVKLGRKSFAARIWRRERCWAERCHPV